MTDEKKFKKRVRERMARTGESYSEARRNLERGQEPIATGERMLTSSDFVDPTADRTSPDPNLHRRFREVSLRDWKSLTTGLLNGASHVSWRNRDAIVDVLNRVGKEARLNHTFFPTGGGLDLTGARASNEPGRVELQFETITVVVRPVILSLFSFERDPLMEWAHLWFDTDGLPPSGVYNVSEDTLDEELVEIEPGRYLGREHWDAPNLGYDEEGYEIELPDEARLVKRIFRGPFVSVAKGSVFNAAYSYTKIERLIAQGPVSFRKYLDGAIRFLHREGRYGVDYRTNDPPPPI